jgi:LPXTG-motif cell wall-anchored protein
MKRLVFLACLLLLSIPLNSRAQDGQGQNQNCQGQQDGSSCGGKQKISAQEMGTIGAGAAVLVGLAGYLVLRRRKSV